jgi:O-succinylbenzoate synthase
MQIAVHRYALVPRRSLGGVARAGLRQGALLRVNGGFADLHPWPELGDLPLDAQIALLARGTPTRQTLASLQMAEIDATARRSGRSLFEGLTIPESHWPGPDAPPEFDTVKMKGIGCWPSGKRLRLDFNATLTADEFLRVARDLPIERIDFVEDPCPYDARVWRELGEKTGLRLALDRVTGAFPDDRAFDVVVHKPALGLAPPPFDGDIVVTSYMDHPVGQFFAAWVAATRTVDRRCGLMTHVLYEPDAFGERIVRDGARLLPPEGTGIGFDDLLEALPWQKLF